MVRRKAPKTPPKVIALASSKGGAGKTTLAAALAVQAGREGARVALIDVDSQKSLWQWCQLRGKPTPKLLELVGAHESIALALAESDWEWVFIDTPPEHVEQIEVAVAHADLVVIPCRPSAPDLLAIDPVIELCRNHNRAFVIVVNQVLQGQGKAALAEIEGTMADRAGDPAKVLKSRLAMRIAHSTAFAFGKSAAELGKDEKAAAEVEALWAEVKAAALKAAEVNHG
jgi:chromosome partitioning protein